MEKDDNTVSINKNKADPYLVALFEDALSKIKAGEIVSAGLVMVNSEMETGHGFAGDYPMLLLAENSLLQREIQDCKIELRLHKAGEPY